MDDWLRGELVDTSVPRTATFGEAARTLCGSGVPAIAVLAEDRRVLGIFGDRNLLRGLFPRYLGELRHTAFLDDDLPALAEHARAVAAEPVEKHLTECETVDSETSSSHVAEKLLHSDSGAVAVVDGGRFVGMLETSIFSHDLAARLGVVGDGKRGASSC